MGAYDGGGGLMCFSPETLSSSDIKRKYAEHKTEEEGQKKNKTLCRAQCALSEDVVHLRAAEDY